MTIGHTGSISPQTYLIYAEDGGLYSIKGPK